MSQERDITLNENNDEKVNFALTTNVPTTNTVLDLTGMSLEMYLKPNKGTADTAGGVWKGTSAGGDLVVTDAANGLCYAVIPAASVTTTQGWYRVDVISSGGKRKTSVYGVVTVNDL